MHDIFLFIQNHSLLITALVTVFFLLMMIEFLKTRSKAISISPAKLIQLVNHQDAAVIDVRSTDAFLNGHIIGAVSIPLRDLSASNPKLEKFKTQPIVLICANGLESGRIAASLKQNGFMIYTLNGGMRAWTEAEMPLVKG